MSQSAIESCPVCDGPMTGGDDWMEHIQLEEWMDCPRGHYSWHFLTGSTRTIVGDREFITSYSRDPDYERLGPTEAEIDRAIEEERDRWIASVVDPHIMEYVNR